MGCLRTTPNCEICSARATSSSCRACSRCSVSPPSRRRPPGYRCSLTAVGGLADLVIDGVTGFSIAAGDVDALAGHLRVLAEQPALRRDLGAASRRRALLEFDAAHERPTARSTRAPRRWTQFPNERVTPDIGASCVHGASPVKVSNIDRRTLTVLELVRFSEACDRRARALDRVHRASVRRVRR